MKLTTFTVLTAAAALTACVTPKVDRHQVALSSSPAGALVSHGAKQCVTPCTLDVRDNFGFNSRYDFAFSLDGYQSQVLSFEEPTVFHGQGVVPSGVHADLRK